MKNSDLPALPARYDERHRLWRCGVKGCEGKLAEVFDILKDGSKPGEENYDGPYLQLLETFDLSLKDGIYRKTKRSAQRSDAAEIFNADSAMASKECGQGGGAEEERHLPFVKTRRKPRFRKEIQERSTPTSPAAHGLFEF